jgi:hypothetical protein
MLRHLLVAKIPNEWMVSAVNGTAFRNEITLLLQREPLFLQKALDRARPCFVRTNVDVADSLRHAGSIIFASISGPSGKFFFSLNVFVHLIFENLERQRAVLQNGLVKLALIKFVSQLFLRTNPQTQSSTRSSTAGYITPSFAFTMEQAT